ncbi:putative iS1 encoded protein [Escherichia coli 2-177-06_S4_C1]|nr:putative iS1 encoded protein [Escherichia coli 2-177-06_S4_C1]
MWRMFHFRTIAGRSFYYFLPTLSLLRREIVRKSWHYFCL